MNLGSQFPTPARLGTRLRSTTALLIGALVLLPVHVTAQDLTWVGPQTDTIDIDGTIVDDLSGEWNTSDNSWESGDPAAPDTFADNDSVIFNNTDPGQAYTVTINVSGNSDPVIATNLTVNGGDLTIDASQSHTLEVTGTITVNDDPGASGLDRLTVNAVISGTSGITKEGDGQLQLEGVNTVTGAVAINDGQLNIGNGGSLNDVTSTTVADGATLGGNGTLGGTVTIEDGGRLQGGLTIVGAVTTVGTTAEVDVDGATIGGLATLTGVTTVTGDTEFNGGVTNSGSFDLNGDTTALGTFENTSTGSITNTNENENVILSGMTVFNNSGAITTQGAMSEGNIIIGATTVNLNDGTDLSGVPVGTLDFIGADGMADTTVNVNGTVVFTNTGTITGSVDVDATASFENVATTSVTGAVTGDGTITVSGGSVGDITGNGMITVSSGMTGNIQGDGTIGISGDADVGNVITAGGLTVADTAQVDLVEFTGETATFSGGSSSDDVHIGLVNTDMTDRTATFDGDFEIGAGGTTADLEIQGGDGSTTFVNITNESSLTVADTVDLNGGTNVAIVILDIDENSELITNGTGIDVGADTTLLNGGTISGGEVVNNGGTITNESTGLVSADLTNRNGMTGNAGELSGTVTVEAGSLTNDGTVSGALNVEGGTVTNNNSLTGTIMITGSGVLDNNAAISGSSSVTLDGATAELNTVPTSVIGVLVTNTDGTINAGGGAFNAGINNSDALNVTADTSASFVNNTGGTVTIDPAVNFTTSIDQTGGLTDIDGTLTGNLTMTSDLVSNPNVDAGAADIDGTLTGNLTTTGAGTVALNGTIGGTVDINADTDGDTVVLTTGEASPGVDSVVTGTVTNAGTINANNTDFQSGITNEAGSFLNVQSESTVGGAGVANNGGTVNVLAVLNGDISNGDGGQVDIDANVNGNIVNNGDVGEDGSDVGVVDIASGVIIDGTLTNTTGDVTQAGTITGAVEANGGQIDNTGALQSTLLVDGGTFNHEAVTGSIAGLTTVDDGVLNANGGSFGTGGIVVNGGELNVEAIYNVAIEAAGGDVNIGNFSLTSDFIQSGSTTINDGTLIDANGLGVAGGEFTNNNIVQSAVTITDGIFNMESGSNVTGAVIVDGGTANANGGTFGTTLLQVNSGDLNINDATSVNVQNDGGQVTMADTTLTGTFTNNSGTASLDGTVTGNVAIAGDVVTDVVDSTADINGTLTLTGGQFNANGGTLASQVTNNGGTLNVDGSNFTVTNLQSNAGNTNILSNTSVNITNDGSEVDIAAGATLTGNVTNNSGDTINNGIVDGNVTLAGGLFRTFDNVTGTIDLTTVDALLNIRGGSITGLVTNDGGEINALEGEFTAGVQNNTGAFNTNGAITVNGIGVVNVNGSVSVRDGSNLTAAISQTGGDASNEGIITGTVDISGGTFTTAGQVTDTVTISGTGAMTVDDDAVFDVAVQSVGGDIFVEGAMQGDITNDGGALRIQNDGDVDGNVVLISNIVNNNGNIQGTATVNGGTFSQRSGADTESLTTVNSGGLLNAEGGDFSGGILMAGGDLSITANTTGDIENDGSDLDLPGGFTLTGDITNTSGNLIVRSDVIGSVTVNDGNTRFTPSSSVIERSFQNGGFVELAGGSFSDGFTALDGQTEVTGAISGKLRTNDTADVLIRAAGSFDQRIIVNDGNLDLRGDAAGGLLVKGGTVVSTGDITGKLVVRNDGIYQHNGGNVTGRMVVRGTADVLVDGGSFGKNIEIRQGTVTIASNTDVNVELLGGELIVNADRTLRGDVDNGGTVLLAGTIDGDLDNTGTTDFIDEGTILGTFTNSGVILFNGEEAGKSVAGNVTARSGATALTIPADIAVIGGLLENEADGEIIVAGQSLQAGEIISAGEIVVSNGQLLLSDTTITLQDGSETTVRDAGLEGDSVIGAAGATLTVRNGQLEGAFSFAGDFNSRGSSELFGDLDLTNQGTLNVSGTGLVIDGTLDAGSNTETTIGAGASLSTNGFTNAGTMTMSDGSTIFGDFRNTGEISLAGSGTLRFAGGIRGPGTVDVTGNGATGDTIRVGGRGINGGTYVLDLDLRTANGTADTIVINNGDLKGDVTLDFNLLGSGARQNDSVIVIDTNGANTDGLNLEYTGLPDDDGPLVYTVSETDGGDFAVTEGLNPAISGLAGSVVLTQSLIGSVINRPSSPFVSGLAIEGEDPCGAGVWARATGGYADSSGSTIDSTLGNQSFSSELELNYGGVQIGGDWACFGGFYNGWDMAFGGIVGANIGEASQPVFGLDGSTDSGFSDELKSVTDFEFTQGYAGIYATAVKGPIAVDLQYRVEETDFVANNEAIQPGAAGLGLNDAEFSSSAQTLSGAISYSMPLENLDLTFVPTAGFAFTQVSTDPITFDGTGVLEVQDFENQVGFIGGTLARTKFGDDGVSAINQFVTATIYNDFAEEPVSIFTPDDGSGERSLTTGNLGTYGELSAGLNYVRILQPGEYGAVRQFNAAVRADVRYSDQLESWGLTAQARIQF